MVMLTADKKKKERKSKGRQKIEIKKIENLNSRQVTFSKRRLGLFKKASELCILSGAQVAILVQSPSNRLFSFGHPTPDAVFHRFLGGDGGDEGLTAVVGDDNREYFDACRELEDEKRMAAEGGGGGEEFWWNNGGDDGMTVEELEQYAGALDVLRMNVVTRADELSLVRKSKMFALPAPAAVHGPCVELAPPQVGWSVDDPMGFLNQDFIQNDMWSGLDQFGQAYSLN